ncbi:MAG TPA: M14 family metallopeptidase [bacterium]|nr:M14 family metallopeptidase [bacterium]
MVLRTTYTPVPVGTLASGAEISVPIHELRGEAGDGPTLGLMACLHGDEQVGTEILYRLMATVDPAQLRGRLLVVPVANPLAYEAITRNTPLDMHNLNRVFPGGGEGFFTHQLAGVLVEHVLNKIDYYVDFHAGGAYATVDYLFIENAEELSRAFGSPVLFRPPRGYGYGGSTASYTVGRGVPTVTVELGGGAIDQTAYVQRGVAGVLNIMRKIKMIPGEPAPAPRQTVLRTLLTMRPRAGGVLVPEVTALNVQVPKGTVLGRTLSPYSFKELEVFRAPFEPSVTVLVRVTPCRINPGDYGYMIGDLSTAETA